MTVLREQVQTAGELFEAVQRAHLFVDSKTFVDALPVRDPDAVLQDFRRSRARAGFDLGAFVRDNFALPRPAEAGSSPLDTSSLRAYIRTLWARLERHPRELEPTSSLIPLEHPYVVPGGRFREIYYWDTYFTALGLVEDGRADLVEGMARNFVALQARLGLVPNGNRWYYATRSQPPVLALLVDLLWERAWAERGDAAEVAGPFLDALEREHAYWTSGGRLLAVPGGTVSRYWDERAVPREEAYHEDLAVAQRSGRQAGEVYRHLRAAAASGWDFSSRWFDEPNDLATIRTTDLAPVDLGALLYALERTVAKLRGARGERAAAAHWGELAEARRARFAGLHWDADGGVFSDHDAVRGAPSRAATLATAWPLFVGLADEAQAAAVAARLERDFLAPGGLRTTLLRTGQQWDAPNGWAPLQWVAAEGLERYGHPALAARVRRRWLALVGGRFARDRCLLEKYDVEDAGARPGGGEYAVQEGFGWTNGVTLAFLAREEQARAAEREAIYVEGPT